MKTKTFTLFFLVISLSFLLHAVKASRGEDGLQKAVHIPYDPFVTSDTIPEYAYNEFSSPIFDRSALLAKPAGVDLDVTIIGRTPMYQRYEVWYTGDGKPYLRPGTESDRRWPAQGELVTFTAHVINKGTVPSGSFSYKWTVDGIDVHSGDHASLGPGEEGTETYQWAWAHAMDGERVLGNHSVGFSVDTFNTIAETYESNNSLEDRTDALSLLLAVTPELYQALETPVDPKWPYSAEDWLQKQIAAMNDAFIRSVYPSMPGGIEERVRLDKIVVTSTAPPTDWAEDGGLFMAGDDRFGNSYYDPDTDVSGGLLHELTHQLGIIDMYNLDIALEIPQVLDRQGRPVQMEYSTSFLFPGLMNDPGITPPIYDEHTALALQANKGYRRGYYGEYLYDVPGQSYLCVLDNEGNPAPGVSVKLYQRSSDLGLYGSRFGTIDNEAEVTGISDNDGLVLLTNRAVGADVSTRTGHTLRDNPFAVIDVVGRNDEFLMELTKGSHQEFRWLDITAFNTAVWQGNDTIEIESHVPADDTPEVAINLDGVLEYGLVKLAWSPSSMENTASYNVYRAKYPAFTYEKVVGNETGLSYSEPYDNGSRAAVYAVTAVDDQGREGGFSNLFYALRLQNPAAVVVDGGKGRIVLDPQNGYALLYQAADGTFLDTRSSFDYHLEYSYYMVRDWQGRLVVSHPGDYYTSRQSVRIFDEDFNLVSEFGDSGTGAGQLQGPAGVATWGEACGSNECRFLVADSGNNRIQVFDENGEFVSTYGTMGSGDGEFNNPQGLVVEDGNGNVIVADSDNNRLQLLNFDGSDFAFVKEIRVGFSKPTGLAVYGTDRIIAADTGNNKIKLLDGQGSLLSEYDGPNDGNGGNFYQPRGVAADYRGNIVVADSGNKRVVTVLDVFPSWDNYLPVIIGE